ncbi:MAG: UpxY family transcription antiterminator [Bacteroidetes bacterium]|nr:UpxY family transcription antiterminator [Bacteroidota bacterium]
MPWYVLYTKPRNEKKTTLYLQAKGINVYCPLQETIKQWSDRKKKVSEPLFKSYVFVHLNEYDKEQIAVLETPGAVRFLWWMGKPGIVYDYEIEQIRQFLSNYRGAKIDIRFSEGDTVHVSEGALQNQTGTIIRIKGNKAFLNIQSLGWNMVAEIPIQNLKE